MKKRTFLKLFSVLLAALMVLGAMPLASAEGLPESDEFLGTEGTTKDEASLKETLIVNCGGKSYEFEYGDTFCYTARFETHKFIENMAAQTKYNSNLLRFVELDRFTMYPNLDTNVIHNANEQNNAVYFNYLFDNNRVDFSVEKTLATYKFEVKGVGECDIEMLFTMLENYSGNEFVDDSGKITEENITLTEYITEETYAGKTTIECGGKTYTFNVGDYFTYTAILWSEEPVTDFFGRRTISASKIIETSEEEMYPNIFYNEGDPAIYFTGQPRGGCDFTTPAVYIQYKLQAAVEGSAVIETIFVELNGYVPDKEGNLPWDYTLTEIITPYGEELPVIPEPSTDDEIIPSEFELGDVNKDGNLNIRDVTAIQKYIAKIIAFDKEAILLADYNDDSMVTIKDATAIQKKLANLI